MSDMSKLNPDVLDFVYGKKDLAKIKVYPLSIGDQMQMTSLISAFMEKLGSAQELAGGKDAEVFKIMADVVVDNLSKVMALVCCIEDKEAEEITLKMTNPQMMVLITHIWEKNYEELVKNGRNLFEKMNGGNSSGSKRSLRQSVKDMVTSSKKSSKKHIKKVD